MSLRGADFNDMVVCTVSVAVGMLECVSDPSGSLVCCEVCWSTACLTDVSVCDDVRDASRVVCDSAAVVKVLSDDACVS